MAKFSSVLHSLAAEITEHWKFPLLAFSFIALRIAFPIGTHWGKANNQAKNVGVNNENQLQL